MTLSSQEARQLTENKHWPNLSPLSGHSSLHRAWWPPCRWQSLSSQRSVPSGSPLVTLSIIYFIIASFASLMQKILFECFCSYDNPKQISLTCHFCIPSWKYLWPRVVNHFNPGDMFFFCTIFYFGSFIFTPTQETYQCLPNLATSDSILMLTLVHFLHSKFLEGIRSQWVVIVLFYHFKSWSLCKIK